MFSALCKNISEAITRSVLASNTSKLAEFHPPPFLNDVVRGISLNDVECPQCRMTQSGFRNIRSCRNNHHYCRLCYEELYESRRPCLICGVDMGSQ